MEPLNLLLVGLLLTQAPVTPSREERVLALLQELTQSSSFAFENADFDEVEPRLGLGPVFVPRILRHCWTSGSSATFDAERARALAAECFGIYGLDVQRELALRTDECSVDLDGVDDRAKLGFELVGRGGDALGTSVPAEVGLEDDDARWLVAHGYRLHVADVSLYPDDDELVSMLAYVAGVVRFLDSVTEGEDVRLDGLFARRARFWSFPGRELEWKQLVNDRRRESESAPATTLRLSFRGEELRVVERFPEPGSIADEAPLAEPHEWIPTLPAPSALLLSGQLEPLDPYGDPVVPRLRLTQSLAGRRRIHEGTGYTLLLPRDFDLDQPFQLEIELPACRGALDGASLRGGFTR